MVRFASKEKKRTEKHETHDPAIDGVDRVVSGSTHCIQSSPPHLTIISSKKIINPSFRAGIFITFLDRTSHDPWPLSSCS